MAGYDSSLFVPACQVLLQFMGASPMSKQSSNVQNRTCHTLLAEGELRLGEFVIPCAVVQGADGKPVRVLSRRQ
jgi:hypothetical protein